MLLLAEEHAVVTQSTGHAAPLAQIGRRQIQSIGVVRPAAAHGSTLTAWPVSHEQLSIEMQPKRLPPS